MATYGEKAIDRAPFIPLAGLPTRNKLNNFSVDLNIRPDLYYQCKTETPDNIKKYRNSIRQRIGQRQLHYGIYDDPRDYEDLVHGVPTASSLHVPDSIQDPDDKDSKHFINEVMSGNYLSNKREPLGKSIVRNYVFPEEVKSPQFRFGISTVGDDKAKDLIYTDKGMHDPEEVKKMYQYTHGLTEPGEQTSRKYNWNIDPKTHVFGFSEPFEADGVKKSVLHDTLKNPYPQTKLVNKRLEDFRTATKDLLGKGKFFGTLHKKVQDPDHTFGVGNPFDKQWNAGRCIYGDGTSLTESMVAPDKDLGKDVRYASKLKGGQPSKRDLNRRYGVPTIRTDLSLKGLKSVTDVNDYGDESDVYELLYPHPENVRGVGDEDFDKLLSKEEIYQLMRKYDFIIPEEEYNVMYEVGLKNYPNAEGKMSAKSFVSTMRNLKREFQKYRTAMKSCC